MGRSNHSACFLIFLFLIFFSASVIVPVCADEVKGDKALQEGRPDEALKEYTSALEKIGNAQLTASESLRKKIIFTAQKINPPPIIPEEARSLFSRGQAKAKVARDKPDFLEAAREFEKALLLAPWSGVLYFNIGIMQEAGGKLQEAIGSYRLYLLAEPGGSNASRAREKIAALEANLEMDRQKKALVRFMNKSWRSVNPLLINQSPSDVSSFDLSISSAEPGEFEITLSQGSLHFKFKGAFEGNSVRARLVEPLKRATDSGKMTLSKAGGMIRAKIEIRWNDGTYSYDDFLGN